MQTVKELTQNQWNEGCDQVFFFFDLDRVFRTTGNTGSGVNSTSSSYTNFLTTIFSWVKLQSLSCSIRFPKLSSRNVCE